MSLSTYNLEYGRHLARLRRRRRRRRRAYAPTSNTACHDNHEKIHWRVSLDFHIRDAYGAPLGGPSGRRSSAIMVNVKKTCSSIVFLLHESLVNSLFSGTFSCCSLTRTNDVFSKCFISEMLTVNAMKTPGWKQDVPRSWSFYFLLHQNASR